MEIFAFIIIALVIGIVCFFIGKGLSTKPIENKNEEIRQENIKLLKEQKELQDKKYSWLKKEKESEKQYKISLESRQRELDKIDSKINDKWNEFHKAESKTKFEEEKAKHIQKEYEDKIKVIEDAKQLAEDAATERRKNLEVEYQNWINNYENNKVNLTAALEEIKRELESLKETKRAAIEAARKEQQVKDNKEDYCLILPIEEELDIKRLKNVRENISKPRAISMCIWSNYYLPIAKEKLPKILGGNEITGIYKITNLKTGECYIGQAKDCKKRIYEHMRAACGVDTPSGNQLYAAIQEYGMGNFSIELLEECSQAELNEKERFFIELYQSNIYGYNGTKGNFV